VTKCSDLTGPPSRCRLKDTQPGWGIRKWRLQMAKDPVCGMDVDESSAEHKFDYRGTTYYFCAAGCQKAFERDPEKFVTGGAEHAEHGH
jgi:YHS domain-containing protein